MTAPSSPSEPLPTVPDPERDVARKLDELPGRIASALAGQMRPFASRTNRPSLSQMGPRLERQDRATLSSMQISPATLAPAAAKKNVDVSQAEPPDMYARTQTLLSSMGPLIGHIGTAMSRIQSLSQAAENWKAGFQQMRDAKGAPVVRQSLSSINLDRAGTLRPIAVPAAPKGDTLPPMSPAAQAAVADTSRRTSEHADALADLNNRKQTSKDQHQRQLWETPGVARKDSRRPLSELGNLFGLGSPTSAGAGVTASPATPPSKTVAPLASAATAPPRRDGFRLANAEAIAPPRERFPLASPVSTSVESQQRQANGTVPTTSTPSPARERPPLSSLHPSLFGPRQPSASSPVSTSVESQQRQANGTVPTTSTPSPARERPPLSSLHPSLFGPRQPTTEPSVLSPSPSPSSSTPPSVEAQQRDESSRPMTAPAPSTVSPRSIPAAPSIPAQAARSSRPSLSQMGPAATRTVEARQRDGGTIGIPASPTRLSLGGDSAGMSARGLTTAARSTAGESTLKDGDAVKLLQKLVDLAEVQGRHGKQPAAGTSARPGGPLQTGMPAPQPQTPRGPHPDMIAIARTLGPSGGPGAAGIVKALL